MTHKYTADDAAAMLALYAELNATNGAIVSISGPQFMQALEVVEGWEVEINAYRRSAYATGDTLGDAIRAALKAWKEATQ